jgi:hypothetical protein
MKVQVSTTIASPPSEVAAHVVRRTGLDAVAAGDGYLEDNRAVTFG